MGPVRSLIDKVHFNRIDLISNYPDDIGRMYTNWVARDGVYVHQVSITDPTSYAEVLPVSEEVFKECCQRCDREGWAFCIHLSPGTPTMHAISALLGKTKFPAKLYQTSAKGPVREETVPFEIDLFVMESLREPDRLLASAALSSPGEVEGFEGIKGESRALREAVSRARRVAIRDINVLLTGETGTGKEMFARAIHKACRRRDKPFVALNCAALPDSLFESEVFGYNKGAFTGATEDHPGAFEQADGGLLFLDEVGELSPESQAKLLRALQPEPDAEACTCIFRRLKSTQDTRVDVRVVAATRKNLLEDCAEGRFRDDLYYRLATVTVALPPLRERRKDIGLLTQTFVERINRQFAKDEPGYEDKTVSAQAQRFLNRHTWPGNARELHHALVQAAAMCDGNVIGSRDIADVLAPAAAGTLSTAALFGRGEGFRLESRLDDIRRRFVEDALRDADGRNNRAAELLGISPSTMSKYCRKYGLSS